MTESIYVAAIDIGAGSGVKLGLFDAKADMVGRSFLPRDRYGDHAGSLVDNIVELIPEMLRGSGVEKIAAAGVCCPGLFQSDGVPTVVANIPFLSGVSLPKLLAPRLSLPVFIANDADVGGLAEWSFARSELLYWVLGGGWGGAWVSADGYVKYPAIDWSGRDCDLHPTNEPGFSLPMYKDELDGLLREQGATWDDFARQCPPGALTGPDKCEKSIRAEAVAAAGVGRWRLFRIFAEKATIPDWLPEVEKQTLLSAANSGEAITRLAEGGFEPAIRADNVFGRAWAIVAKRLLERAARDGLSGDTPIFISGGVSRALGRFKPYLEKALDEGGAHHPLLLSYCEEKGINANLLGAAVMGLREAARGMNTEFGLKMR